MTNHAPLRNMWVVPAHYTQADIERVENVGSAFANLQPVFIGTITYRARFTVGANGKIIKTIIKG